MLWVYGTLTMKVKAERFDFLVLGGGSAGYAAARTAHELGKQVAVVDGSRELGGLCILRGCMPSKALIYASEVLHLARQGKTYGFSGEPPVADLGAMQERKRKVIQEFADFRKEQLEDGRFCLYRQWGEFLDAHTVVLSGGEVLQADKILISTGSKARVPSIPGLADCSFKTSDDVLDLEVAPEECVVLGGGVVACELAQFLSRVGCKVTLLQRSPQLLRGFSLQSAQVVEQAFRDEGMVVRTGLEFKSFENVGVDRTRIIFEQGGREERLETDFLFNALGRDPATGNLGLSKLGVELMQSGHLKTDSWQRTNVENLYAAGDCSGPHELVHVAVRQGETAAKHAFGRPVEPMNYDHLLGVVFTDPQVSRVGLTREQIRARGIEVISASYPFDDHGKSILMDAKYGYVAVHADRFSGAVLGAECVSKDAGELIHSMSVGVALKAKVNDLIKADWYHPTLSEIWTYPLEELADEIGGKKAAHA